MSSLSRLVPGRNGVLTNYCKSELAIFPGCQGGAKVSWNSLRIGVLSIGWSLCSRELVLPSNWWW